MLYIILFFAIYHFNAHFSLYIFYLIFFSVSTMEMMSDKKQIQAIFLLVFKMSCKALDIIFYINDGPETSKEDTVQWWFKKFCKADDSLEVKECSAWPLELTMTNWERLSKLILLWEKLPKNSTLTILWLFGIWSKLERWKSSKMGVSWTDQRFLKNVDLKCQLLLLYTTTHFLIRLWCAMKSGFYKTTSDEQLSGWTEKFQSTFQSQTSTKKKKKSWSLFGCLLPSWSITAFWILVKPLHLRNMVNKLMRYTENWNACT